MTTLAELAATLPEIPAVWIKRRLPTDDGTVPARKSILDGAPPVEPKPRAYFLLGRLGDTHLLVYAHDVSIFAAFGAGGSPVAALALDQWELCDPPEPES